MSEEQDFDLRYKESINTIKKWIRTACTILCVPFLLLLGLVDEFIGLDNLEIEGFSLEWLPEWTIVPIAGIIMVAMWGISFFIMSFLLRIKDE